MVVECQCLPLWVGVENVCFINGFSHQGRVRCGLRYSAKRNETKRNETKRNETRRDETKRNETKRNETNLIDKEITVHRVGDTTKIANPFSLDALFRKIPITADW